MYDNHSFTPSAKFVDGKSYSIISDYLGTPILSYDENGRKVWERELDIYGKLISGDNGFIPFLYQGQYYDEETELAYNRFRYYSLDSGTYISQDPIGLASGEPNFYAYVSDSNSWVDVFGLVPRAGNTSFIGDALHPGTVYPDNPGGLIKIQATGSHAGDKIPVYDQTKINHVWSDEYRVHHVDYDAKTNTMTMQIVKTKDHAMSHVGGAKDFKDDTGFKYNTPEAKAEAARRSKLQGCK